MGTRCADQSASKVIAFALKGMGAPGAALRFVRIHKTLKVTPAMAAGVTPKLWEMSDMVGVLEEYPVLPLRALIADLG